MGRQRRREFLQGSLALAGLGLLSGCGMLPPQAQQGNIPRIGFLSANSADETTEAFRAGLRELGYDESRNIVVDYRFADGALARLPALAAELAALQPVVIVAGTTPPAQAARQAAPTTPIVLAGGDPIGAGLITNQARPEGNFTGLTTSNAELTAKRLELLKAAVPAISRVAFLSDPNGAIAPAVNREAQRAAGVLGLQLLVLSARDADEIAVALADLVRERAEGLLVSPGGSISVHRSTIARQAAADRIPAASEWRDFAIDGGLLAYGPNHRSLHRRAAAYVDKILKGAKPAELPVEQPTTFDFVVSLKTAQALGLTIPQSVLMQATEIIQ